MTDRRIVLTLVAVLGLATAISGLGDQAAESYAQDAFKRALVTFAAVRTLNGVISVVQSTEVGVGVTVSVGQILDPINDLVERFSAVMLVATSSLGLQNVLLRITASPGLTIALAVAAAFAIAALWSRRLAQSKFAAAASRLLLIMLFLRFFIPALVIATNLVADAFLAEQQVEATAALEVTSRNIDDLRSEVETAPPAEQSMMDKLSAAIDESLAAVNISERLARLRDNASSATEHIVDLIVLFVMQTILLPLLVLWLLVQLLKGAAARWTQA